MDLTDNLAEVGRDILGPVRDLGSYIRSQRTAAQISLRALAEKAGVSNPYLSQVERGLRRPSAAILTQIADGLSISAESLLTKAGILRPSEQATPVVEAIRADQDLSERQKASLIDVYAALRHESLARRGADESTDESTDERTDESTEEDTEESAGAAAGPGR